MGEKQVASGSASGTEADRRDGSAAGLSSVAATSENNDWRWAAALAATLAILLLINPLGFIGGGWDDWQYLTAARCWADYGPCLPRTHWEGRWPVFAPIALIFSVFGESRLTLGLWPLACSISAILLVAAVGNRAFGRPIGWIGALILLVTPAFSIQILDPSVEAIELALILGGGWFILLWTERRAPFRAFLAGLCFALAFQVRETSVIAALFAGVMVIFLRPRWTDLFAAVVGFALPFAIELIAYWITTGDPLFRRRLSLAHTQIPSSELLAPIDRTKSPVMNPDYIANWRHEPGLHLHWAIDGFLNLFFNAKAGLTLSLTLILALLYRGRLDQADRSRIARLYGAAILYAAILIYVLAMDPKARIMFAPLTATSLAFAIICCRLWSSGKQLIIGVAALGHATVGLAILLVHQRTDVIEGPVADLIARYPGQLETDANTRRHLALVPGLETIAGLDSDRPILLYNSVSPCERWLEQGQLLRQSIQIIQDYPISRLRQLSAQAGGSFCVLRYQQQVDAKVIRVAISRSRRDGNSMFDSRTYLGVEPLKSQPRDHD